jgi:hypothetical protein
MGTNLIEGMTSREIPISLEWDGWVELEILIIDGIFTIKMRNLEWHYNNFKVLEWYKNNYPLLKWLCDCDLRYIYVFL